MREREELIVAVRLCLALAILVILCMLLNCSGRKFTVEVNPDKWSIEQKLPPTETENDDTVPEKGS